MSRGPSEDVRLYQIRVGLKASDALEQEAKAESKAVAHVLRRIVEDYATLYDLPRSAVDSLEADRKALGLDRRGYLKELLDHRYRQVLAHGPGAPVPTREAVGSSATAGGRKK
jgi:hypothetical protein